jgi:hypothetical protein
MQLWSFIWTRPCDRYVSARVAAATKAEAETLLDAKTGDGIAGAEHVIYQFAGRVDAPEGVIDLIPRALP